MDKNQVINHCRIAIEQQLNQIKNQLESIREARDQENKSSAGDKYETGRAMMQSEEERIQNQYDLNQMLLRDLEETSKLPPTDHVQKGSLVQTREQWFFLSVPMGKLRLTNGDCYAISVSSPLGMELLGKQKGDRFDFRGRQMEVLNLL